MNEKMPYPERGQVHFDWDADRREYRNLLLFMVYDEAVAQSPSPARLRPPIPMPGESSPLVISGATWPELGAALEARLAQLESHTGGFRLGDGFVDGLVASVARFNEMAATGVDLDHRRGETPIERLWADPPRPGAASPSMYPLAAQGPYHCIILAAGALDTKGGPVIDELGRVLGVDDEPIPGLYGAGNCIASPAAQGYWGPGGTIGLALVFGHLAGRNAASEAPRFAT